MPILPTLPHRTPRALCGGVKKNTNSLVKGMILCDQGGGGGGGGGKGHGQKRSPRQSVVRMFLLLFAQRKFLII